MISYSFSDTQMPYENVLYTVASTFEKKNSLIFRLVFGKPEISRATLNAELTCSNSVEYFFKPGQIFGFEMISRGRDFKKFHHFLVLRSCDDGECGVVVPGINPGAEVLIQATNNSASLNLINDFIKISNLSLDLTSICPEKYRHMNNLLYLNMPTKFFIGELIEQAKNY